MTELEIPQALVEFKLRDIRAGQVLRLADTSFAVVGPAPQTPAGPPRSGGRRRSTCDAYRDTRRPRPTAWGIGAWTGIETTRPLDHRSGPINKAGASSRATSRLVREFQCSSSASGSQDHDAASASARRPFPLWSCTKPAQTEQARRQNLRLGRPASNSPATPAAGRLVLPPESPDQPPRPPTPLRADGRGMHNLPRHQRGGKGPMARNPHP
jgi:hypothetical protein